MPEQQPNQQSASISHISTPRKLTDALPLVAAVLPAQDEPFSDHKNWRRIQHSSTYSPLPCHPSSRRTSHPNAGMESLLAAIDNLADAPFHPSLTRRARASAKAQKNQQQNHQQGYRHIPSPNSSLPLDDSPCGTGGKRANSPPVMSIASLLDSPSPHSSSPNELSQVERSVASILVATASRSSPTDINTEQEKAYNGKQDSKIRKRSRADSGAMSERENRIVKPRHSPAPTPGTFRVICQHASVAQKSYGGEKRFLCPPPVVRIQGFNGVERPHAVLSVIGEGVSQEQSTPLGTNLTGMFKYLHVSAAKSKQFRLHLCLETSSTKLAADSAPITIISKPSKKTAKARNVSTCVLSNSRVSLFNRINSQTVRTKYMSVEAGRLCAKNSSWSAFCIRVLNTESASSQMSPEQEQEHERDKDEEHSQGEEMGITLHTSDEHDEQEVQEDKGPSPQNAALEEEAKGGVEPPKKRHKKKAESNDTISASIPLLSCAPVLYGTEIELFDPDTGVSTGPLIVRKVEKGRVARNVRGPVSQMQKVALQRVGSDREYLSASPSTSSDEERHTQDGSTFLSFQRSRMVHREGEIRGEEEMGDLLCWTIVGISEFEAVCQTSSSQE
ncbi:uncharacterized protein VTP21DRAFT_3065 [Calcarisporiella thermophila]|uniref:uncharacterized protein n=1 Tax=Calcarisporiella thermophila TaxID=911321 RepID=UPI003742FAA8